MAPLTAAQTRLLQGLGLAGYVAACFALGQGPLHVGPSEWDDTLYMESAARGDAIWYLRNRYVHIWSLRLAYALVEPRAAAAALYSTAVVASLGLAGYALARRSAGQGAGWCALVLVPLFPSLLRYFTVPQVDLTTALWCMLALLAAATALDAPPSRTRSLGAALAGLCGFFAMESKEPGLVVPPLVLYYLARRGEPARARTLGAWAAGTALGCALLLALDLAFTRSGGFLSANPLEYLGGVPSGAVRALTTTHENPAQAETFRLRHEYLGQLTAPGFLAFTLLGLGGAARDFARSTVAQLLTGLCLGSLLLSVVVASWVPGIEANDRYVLVPGAALAVLGALFVHGLWREPPARVQAGWVPALVFGALGFALWASLRAFGTELAVVRSTVFFAVPAALGVGFVGLHLGLGRLGTRVALAGLLLLGALASVQAASRRIVEQATLVAPWQELARRLDAAGGGKVRIWRGGQYSPARVRRRLRALSTLPVGAVDATNIHDPATLRRGEWLLVGAERADELHELGMRRLLQSADEDRKRWSVYVR